MNVYYNQEGIGDTLLIYIKEINLNNRMVEKTGDIAKIIDKETKEIAGYNFFNASKYVAVNDFKGPVNLTEDLIAELNKALNENGVNETLNPDLSPKFVVGHVTEKEKHPNADKLSVCKVDVGTEVLQIVCGAPNVDSGQYVVVAKVGAVMPSGLVIRDAELRGVASSGMICSAKELDLPDAPSEKGILVLEAGKYEAGQPFSS
ncbi:YtpR family tRNA-binding protein [Sutcliffiella horikoshii]|uniref:YtpR family tRNA-binding protein n=1 Tax=Sutcliffiella horikoshii TaxID=79883 RepID=UPI00384E9ADE